MITDLLDITKQFQTESRKLKAWEMKLIEMRNEGRPYHEIRDILKANFPKAKTGFAETYLRTCLMNGGRLFNAFSAYNEMTAMESMSEGIQARRNAHNLAVSTTIALLSKKYKPEVRLNASKYIQDRNEGITDQPNINNIIQSNVEVALEIKDKLPQKHQRKFLALAKRILGEDE